MKLSVAALILDESGQGLVEYSIIILLVAIVAITGLTFLGKRTGNSIQNSALTAPLG